jgi:hypothetical protein
VGTEGVEDLGWCAAAHVIAVVAATVVVSDQPGVGFGLEMADAGEAATVERRPPAFLQGGAVEVSRPGSPHETQGGSSSLWRLPQRPVDVGESVLDGVVEMILVKCRVEPVVVDEVA